MIQFFGHDSSTTYQLCAGRPAKHCSCTQVLADSLAQREGQDQGSGGHSGQNQGSGNYKGQQQGSTDDGVRGAPIEGEGVKVNS